MLCYNKKVDRIKGFVSQKKTYGDNCLQIFDHQMNIREVGLGFALF